MNPLTQSKNTTILPLLAPLVFVCFGLMPRAQAVGPDTDGSIPGSNNGEGIGVLVSRTTGVSNTGTGYQALNHLTGGNYNTATGYWALFSDTTGGFNTATGLYSLTRNTSGFNNSATGAYSLWLNTTGSNNTATGYGALYSNTASNNTATGFSALYRNHTSSGNTATGASALFSNTTGSANTAVRRNALYDNTTGGSHTAVGYSALKNTIASGDFTGNTAVGSLALFNDTTGNGNVAVGWGAGLSLTTGSSNTATGTNALSRSTANSSYNTANGYNALVNMTFGTHNTALGWMAGRGLTRGFDNVYIGAGIYGVDGESNTTRINNIGITPLAGQTVPVLVEFGGNKLGYLSSSRNNKDDIKPMDNASEGIYCLRPVSFRYKPEIDPTGVQQYGLIAENVEEVNPDLVVRDKEGKAATLRFEAVNAMLLNEFLKEHRKVAAQGRRIQEQETTIAQLKQDFQSKLSEQQKQIEALTAGLRKVSAQVEMGRPAPRVVVKNQ